LAQIDEHSDQPDLAAKVAKDLLELSAAMRKRGRFFLFAVLVVVLFVAPTVMLAQNILTWLEENQRQAEWDRDKLAAETAQSVAEQNLDDKLRETEELIDGYNALAAETGHLWYYMAFDGGPENVRPLAMLPPRPGVPASNPIAVFELSGVEGTPVLMAAIQTGPHSWNETFWPATDLPVDGSRSIRKLHRLGENEVLVIDSEGRTGIGFAPASAGQSYGLLGPNVGGEPASRSAPFDIRTTSIVVLDDFIHLFTLPGDPSLNTESGLLEQHNALEWRTRPLEQLRGFVRLQGQRQNLGGLFVTRIPNGKIELDRTARRFAAGGTPFERGVWLLVDTGTDVIPVLVNKTDDGYLSASPDEPDKRGGLSGDLLWFSAESSHTAYAVMREESDTLGGSASPRTDGDCDCDLLLLRLDTRLFFRSCFGGSVTGTTIGSGTPVGPALVRGDGFLHLVERKNAGFSIWRISSAGVNETVSPIDIDPFVAGSRIVPVTAALTAAGQIALGGRLTDPSEGGSRPVILESISLPPFSESSVD
jgi:hypothetical protein